jgi:hypothetical protein
MDDEKEEWRAHTTIYEPEGETNIFFNVDHGDHRDFLDVSDEETEIFFRHPRPNGQDDHHMLSAFFQPLFASFQEVTFPVSRLIMDITYANEGGVQTVPLLRFKEIYCF